MLPYSRFDPALPQRRIQALRAEARSDRRARALRPAPARSPAASSRRRLGRALIAVGRHLAADGRPSPARTP